MDCFAHSSSLCPQCGQRVVSNLYVRNRQRQNRKIAQEKIIIPRHTVKIQVSGVSGNGGEL
jgi:hypothetical protein